MRENIKNLVNKEVLIPQEKRDERFSWGYVRSVTKSMNLPLNKEAPFSEPEQSDQDLMIALQQGNRMAFSTLIERHHRRFFRLAYRILSNQEDAEDVVQDAFVKLWSKPKTWNPKKSTKFTTWFYRVVMNLSLDHKKKKRPQLNNDLDNIAVNINVTTKEDEINKQDLLEKWIQDLPTKQLLALNLCFYEELTNKEAAEIIGISVKALESLLMRAKKTLRKKAEHDQ